VRREDVGQIRLAKDGDRCRDSSVGITTRCGVDVPRIESRWWANFPKPSRPSPEPTQPPIQLVPGHSLGKAAEAWR